MIDVYLGLGSNMGDREAQLKAAIDLLDAHDKINVVAISPIYETKPVGYTEQPDFFEFMLTHSNTTFCTRLVKGRFRN